MKRVAIVGAGLAGTMLALYLERRGYEIDLFEARAKLNNKPQEEGRSINLALSHRGLSALTELGLKSEVKKLLAPMRSRAIHEQDGSLRYQPFGRHSQEYINAIVRHDLNVLLLNQAQLSAKIKINFSLRLNSIDFKGKKLIFQSLTKEEVTHNYHYLIGADGASSVVRDALTKQGLIDFNRDYLPYGYKELSILPQGGLKKSFAKECLHLWPRESFLLLGNPNRDHSLTGSLFLAHEGQTSFANLDSDAKIHAFFQQAFPDAYPLMPSLIEEFVYHPIGHMSTINCNPWHYADHCLLIGDAAHGIVPFFGQGMNSAFEDCRILNLLLDEYEDDWAKVMPCFYAKRKPNTDAVAKMSMDNFKEIQTDLGNPVFCLKKKIEKLLMQRYPHRYVSKHILVMFSNTPYSQALRLGEIQEAFLANLMGTIKNTEDMNWDEIDKAMMSYDEEISAVFPAKFSFDNVDALA